MIIKWVLLGVIIYIVYILFFRDKTLKQNDKYQKNSDNKDKDSEEMVECTVCGTFVASSETYIKNGKFYCSKECMKKGQ